MSRIIDRLHAPRHGGHLAGTIEVPAIIIGALALMLIGLQLLTPARLDRFVGALMQTAGVAHWPL